MGATVLSLLEETGVPRINTFSVRSYGQYVVSCIYIMRGKNQDILRNISCDKN